MLGDPDLFASAHIHGLDALVHLSDEQKRNLYAVFYAELQMATAIMSDSSLRDDQKGEQIQQVHKRTAAQIDSILTPDQRKALAPPSTRTPTNPSVQT